MKKVFYTVLVILIFNSCIEEYEVFYPYINTSINYLEQLQDKKEKAIFIQSEGLSQEFENKTIVELDKNSFDDSNDSVIFSLQQINTGGKLIANRISLKDENNKLIRNINIIDFSFYNRNGKKISIKRGNFIKFKIPEDSTKSQKIYRLTPKGWVESSYKNDNLVESTWKILTGEEPKDQNGYIFTTDRQGIFCIGKPVDEENKVSRLRINLPKGFNVDNSIVQLSLPDFNTNLELYWNDEIKTFELPHNLQLPQTQANVIVLSENSDNQAFFGMKYAILRQGELLEVDVSKKRIEEIKSILDNL